nr:tripartite tricarboxylate transporter TctB family protein [Brevibacillus fulvus]
MALIILSVAAWITASDFPAVGDTDVGAGFFPKMIASVLILLSLVMIFSSFRRQPGNEPETGAIPWSKTILGFILTFLYLALVYFGGFYISTPLFMICFIWLFGYRKTIPAVAVTVVVTLFVYLVFEKVLQVPLPAGVFFE